MLEEELLSDYAYYRIVKMLSNTSGAFITLLYHQIGYCIQRDTIH